MDDAARRAAASKLLGIPLTEAAKASENTQYAAQAPLAPLQPVPVSPAPLAPTMAPLPQTAIDPDAEALAKDRRKKTRKRRIGIGAVIVIAVLVIAIIAIEMWMVGFSLTDFQANVSKMANSAVQTVQGWFAPKRETPTITPPPITNTVEPDADGDPSSPATPEVTPEPKAMVSYLDLIDLSENEALAKLAPNTPTMRELYEDQHGVVIVLHFEGFQLRLRGEPLRGDEVVNNEWIAAQTGPVFKVVVLENDSPIENEYPLIGKTKEEAQALLSDVPGMLLEDTTINQLFYRVVHIDGFVEQLEVYLTDSVVTQLVYSAFSPSDDLDD